MNSDKSQHSKDNWVQKTVRNLEGMNKARHASVDQSNEKPPSDYLKSKRNSAPVSIVTSTVCVRMFISIKKRMAIIIFMFFCFLVFAEENIMPVIYTSTMSVHQHSVRPCSRCTSCDKRKLRPN